ncbi:response regulator transcription factor [Vagococcus xieshaowenii]|uniref:Response regulator n=1 Tax=Vagococcus xieshaowenii TaxID=2562451 RepID=A0A4Z0D6R9_9ENTE|nr:response regulator [Vagococcus xieshaowenii]QCA28644.1 response regulator [Vagococcus xieshaowenii]TFZ40548.1 response regulator [Vagococcus xieshaowenii]
MSYKYSILLVDDEQEIRDGMSRQIPWNQCGFELLTTAENGLEALELVERLKPDVIITDIKMPFMSGLEFINKASQISPLTKFIVCSGFDDFEYAQQAISLSVFSYVLKPISSNEFVNVLVNLKQKMDSEWKEKKESLSLKNQLASSESIIYDNFLISCMQGAIEENQMATFSKLIGFNQEQSYCVFSLRVDKSNHLLSKTEIKSNHQDLLVYAIKNIFDEWLIQRYSIHSLLIGKDLFYIIEIEDEQEINQLMIDLNALCKQSTKLSDAYVFGGVSFLTNRLSKLSQATHQAITAVQYSTMLDLENNFVTFMGDVKDRLDISYLSIEEDSKLITLIKKGTAIEIETIIHDIFNEIEEKKFSIKSYHLYIIDIFNSIIKTANLYKIKNDELFGDTVPNITEILSKHPKHIIESWLIGLCKNINEMILHNNEKTRKNIIDDSLDYINREFDNPDLTVELISKKLYLSSTYFSTLFKREMGQSFISYLTEIRLSKARYYLEKTNDKNYIIAEKIGYSDPNYFGYVFKKKYGISPKQYRQTLTTNRMMLTNEKNVK